MRILVISNLYPPAAVGGYETRCAHTVRWLAREHEVLVLTSRRGGHGWPGRRAGRSAQEAEPGRRRGGRAQEAERGRRGGSSAQEAEPPVLRKLPFLPEDASGTLRAPLASLYASRLLRRVVRRHRPDLVFVWNASHIPRAAIRALQQRRDAPPLAFSVADPWLGRFVPGDQFMRYLEGHERGPHRAWAALVRLVNRLPSLRVDPRPPLPAALVWNSEALQALTPVPGPIEPVLERVIHPASAHEALFAAVEHRQASTPTIAFVGRIEVEKAPDVAVRALGLLRDRHGIDARLLVLGGGEPAAQNELQRLVDELELREQVQLRGKMPVEGVAAALGEAHAIVVPSRWQEPFGLVCLEAALARVPVVASLSGGMPEMLKAGEEALFFPIDDVEACAQALAQTLADPVSAQQRALRARERAEAYSLARYRAAYEAFVVEARAACAGQGGTGQAITGKHGRDRGGTGQGGTGQGGTGQGGTGRAVTSPCVP